MRLRSGRQNQEVDLTLEPNNLSPESSELQPVSATGPAPVPAPDPDSQLTYGTSPCRPDNSTAATKREHPCSTAARDRSPRDPSRPPIPDEEEAERPHSAASLEALVEAAAGSDPRDRLAAVQAIRKLLSSDKNPPIDALVQGGVLPVLVRCLQAEDEWVPGAPTRVRRDEAIQNGRLTGS